MFHRTPKLSFSFIAILLLRSLEAFPSELCGEEAIQAARLLGHVQVLASPEMEGRAAGTIGAVKAAAYIAQEFRKIGLKAPNKNGSYFQTFEVTTGIKPGSKNELTIEGVLGRKTYHPGSDFSPLASLNDDGVTGEIVFAGYGITAAELGYDDYAGIDVKGRIVVVMSHEPRERDRKGPFRRPEAFRYRGVGYKLINAREHGAKGVILVTDPSNHEKDKLLQPSRRSSQAGIIAAQARWAVADEILGASGKRLVELQKEIDATLTPRSYLVPGLRAHLRASLIREKGETANVVGILPGRDAKLGAEAIVIGAHYDGLGRGGEGSLAPERYGEIHPGADDNASGVAGVIELARAFARSGSKRTLVFVAFAAEEIGLLGSSHYVENPVWPLEKTYAMINLDGIGRLRDDRLYVLGVDSARELRSIVEKPARELKLELRLRGDGFGPSDHTPFYAKKRPVLMFFTGAHKDYHRPSDTVEKINAAGMEKTSRLVFRTLAELAGREEPLTFVWAKSVPSRTESGEGGGYGPYFGSIPDFSESPVPGIRLTGVRPGSPAERAGLKAGDIIVEFAGVKIRNLEDLLFALRSKRPGDEVDVRYLRDGKEARTQATLAERQ